MMQALHSILAKKDRLAVGIMSGTSLDGIDIAFCRITGTGTDTAVQLLYFDTIEYSSEEKQRLLQVCSSQTGRVDEVCALNKYVGVRIGQGIVKTAQKAGIPLSTIDFVSSHGQTIFHSPEKGATLQIGELADIAAITGAVTVGDFRPSDMAYGGQGAPLIPFVDYVLYHSNEASRILINVGGISNLTAMRKACQSADIIAFDTGPGNVLLDNLVKIHTDGTLSFDRDGDMARKGSINTEFLEAIRSTDPFLALPPPKSTGRELYTLAFANQLLEKGSNMQLSFFDILATVTDYTALALEYSIKQFIPFKADEIYLSGGGIHNTCMMDCLQKRLGQTVHPLKKLGLPGDAKEAVGFAILGNELLFGTTNNAPQATGASRDVVMGKIALPSGLALPCG